MWQYSGNMTRFQCLIAVMVAIAAVCVSLEAHADVCLPRFVHAVPVRTEGCMVERNAFFYLPGIFRRGGRRTSRHADRRLQRLSHIPERVPCRSD